MKNASKDIISQIRHWSISKSGIVFHLQTTCIYTMVKDSSKHPVFLPENNYVQYGIYQILFQNTDAWINQLKEKINTNDQGWVLCLRLQTLSLRCFYANMFHLILSSLCSKITPQFIMITFNFSVRRVYRQNNYTS